MRRRTTGKFYLFGKHRGKHRKKYRPKRIFRFLFYVAATALIAVLAFGENGLPGKGFRGMIYKKNPGTMKKGDTVLPYGESNKPDLTDEWLILVNHEHPLPEDYSVRLKKVQNHHEVDERIADYVINMIQDAKKENINLLICSSYRSVERQQELFNEEVEKYITAGKSNDEALAEAAFGVAVPGHSEHNTGLALDIVTPAYQMLNSDFETTDAFRWLDKNAHRYGFILRYPKDKTEITQIKYEPWHYRFVGLNHAAIMKEKGLTLEEYLSDTAH